MSCKYITWEDIKPIWATELWSGRVNVEPVTSMKYLGGHDMELKKKTPHFIGVFKNDELVGVNSFVRTSKTQFRSRGLWVNPEHRGNGYAQELLYWMKSEVLALGGWTIWTLPRQASYSTYASVGFIQTTPYTELEWGNNCYALASTRTIQSIECEARNYKQHRSLFFHKNLAAMVDNGDTTEKIRSAMRPLANEEERLWK
jgi:predicted GNAT family N-acyltransferase